MTRQHLSVEKALARVEHLLWSLANRHATPVTPADDLFQEASLKFCEDYPQYQPECGALTTWAYKRCLGAVMDAAYPDRKRREGLQGLIRYAEEVPFLQMRSAPGSLFSDLWAKEALQYFSEEVAQVLRFLLAECSGLEIAESLGCSIFQYQRLRQRARREYRQIMSEHK